MHRGAKNSLIAITGFLFFATSASFCTAVDNAPSDGSSYDALVSALYLAEDSSAGLVSLPGMLDSPSHEPAHESVSHLGYELPSVHDPRQLIIDPEKLAPPLTESPSTWQASLDFLGAARRNEEIFINGDKLGTGINAGARARLENRCEDPGRFLNAWDIIAIGLNGEDSLYYDPRMMFAPDPYHYQASFVSVESNAIHRTQYKRRVREQLLGIRYIDQSDSIEQSGRYPDSPSRRQETHNRMLGLQVGLEQSWTSLMRWRFGWGAKAGVFYNHADQAGLAYDGTADTFPLLLDCHADLACRIFEQAYLGIGLIGMRLDDQYQSRFAWQAPESTHRLTLLGMRFGFDYTY